MSQSSPSAWMRNTSSVSRSGRSGMARTASERAIVCSRDTNSGGCHAVVAAMSMVVPRYKLLFGQDQACIGTRPQRDGTTWRQIGLTIEQALQYRVAAADLGFDRDAREDRKGKLALERIDGHTPAGLLEAREILGPDADAYLGACPKL